MTLEPYRISSPDGERKRHVFPTDAESHSIVAPCGNETPLVQTALVSRIDFVELDLDGHLCKRCLRSLGHIDEYDDTIARRIG